MLWMLSPFPSRPLCSCDRDNRSAYAMKGIPDGSSIIPVRPWRCHSSPARNRLRRSARLHLFCQRMHLRGCYCCLNPVDRHGQRTNQLLFGSRHDSGGNGPTERSPGGHVWDSLRRTDQGSYRRYQSRNREARGPGQGFGQSGAVLRQTDRLHIQPMHRHPPPIFKPKWRPSSWPRSR